MLTEQCINIKPQLPFTHHTTFYYPITFLPNYQVIHSPLVSVLRSDLVLALLVFYVYHFDFVLPLYIQTESKLHTLTTPRIRPAHYQSVRPLLYFIHPQHTGRDQAPLFRRFSLTNE